MSSGRRRFIVFMTVIVGIILLIMLITRIGSNKSSTPKTASKKPAVVKPISVTDYAQKDSKVVLTIDGKINGDDQHRAIRITVSPDFRVAEIIQGYENKVIKTQTDLNNRTAYTDFIYAINRYGFSKERKTASPDDRGACPLGNRYIYEIYDDGNSVMRRWAASCGGIGTSAGSPSQLNDLFQKQVNEYFKFVTGIQL